MAEDGIEGGVPSSGAADTPRPRRRLVPYEPPSNKVERSLIDHFETNAQRTPHARLYTWIASAGCVEAEAWSYAQLAARARVLCACLRRRWGASSGARILLLHPPGIEFVAAFFGCQYAALVAVPYYPPLFPHSPLPSVEARRMALNGLARVARVHESCRPELVLSTARCAYPCTAHQAASRGPGGVRVAIGGPPPRTQVPAPLVARGQAAWQRVHVACRVDVALDRRRRHADVRCRGGMARRLGARAPPALPSARGRPPPVHFGLDRSSEGRGDLDARPRQQHPCHGADLPQHTTVRGQVHGLVAAAVSRNGSRGRLPPRAHPWLPRGPHRARGLLAAPVDLAEGHLAAARDAPCGGCFAQLRLRPVRAVRPRSRAQWRAPLALACGTSRSRTNRG
eukprot:scaffold123610_cov25-Tisochrysis_lutea.AAC.6